MTRLQDARESRVQRQNERLGHLVYYDVGHASDAWTNVWSDGDGLRWVISIDGSGDMGLMLDGPTSAELIDALTRALAAPGDSGYSETLTIRDGGEDADAHVVLMREDTGLTVRVIVSDELDMPTALPEEVGRRLLDAMRRAFEKLA